MVMKLWKQLKTNIWFCRIETKFLRPEQNETLRLISWNWQRWKDPIVAKCVMVLNKSSKSEIIFINDQENRQANLHLRKQTMQNQNLKKKVDLLIYKTFSFWERAKIVRTITMSRWHEQRRHCTKNWGKLHSISAKHHDARNPVLCPVLRQNIQFRELAVSETYFNHKLSEDEIPIGTQRSITFLQTCHQSLKLKLFIHIAYSENSHFAIHKLPTFLLAERK